MPQSFGSLHCHIVFSTKDRQPLIDADLRPHLFAYCGGVLAEKKCRLTAAGGIPDHVHLLVSLSREASVAEAVRLVKANSSKWVHESFPERRHFSWQVGYAAFAVSFSQIDRVRHYLDRQEEHHRTHTYKDELLGLLRKHQIEYDERYMWD
jgi:putative transposase